MSKFKQLELPISTEETRDLRPYFDTVGGTISKLKQLYEAEDIGGLHREAGSLFMLTSIALSLLLRQKTLTEIATEDIDRAAEEAKGIVRHHFLSGCKHLKATLEDMMKTS